MLRFAEFLELQDFRPRTSTAYYRCLRLLAEHFACDPSGLHEEQLRGYFVHLRRDLSWAPRTLRQSLAAVKLFYRGMLGRQMESLDQIKARDRESLPTILTPDEVGRVIRAIPFQRYRIPLLLIYASGLRVRECTHLQVDDIEGSANRLIVRDGKGGKDRYTILSTPVYEQLRRYWRYHRNPTWIFPAVGRGLRDSAGAARHMARASDPMDPNSLRSRLLAAAKAEGITKKVTCHILRHSFASHLAAAGVPLHQLQAYLGHAHIETTTVYTHLTPISHREAIEYVDALIAPILRS
jgi:integrase/recombinase XerD